MELTNTYTPTEIVFHGRPTKVGVMIKANVSLAKGTFLGKVTATEYYAAYSSVAVDGTEKAIGVLAEAIDTTSAGTNAATEAPMITGNAYLVKSALTGYDASILSDIPGARVIEQSGANGVDILYLP